MERAMRCSRFRLMLLRVPSDIHTYIHTYKNKGSIFSQKCTRAHSLRARSANARTETEGGDRTHVRHSKNNLSTPTTAVIHRFETYRGSISRRGRGMAGHRRVPSPNDAKGRVTNGAMARHSHEQGGVDGADRWGASTD